MFCNDYKLHRVFLYVLLQGCFVSFHNVVSNYIDDTLGFDIICIIFHGCDDKLNIPKLIVYY
jgi:hypothetical protein